MAAKVLIIEDDQDILYILDNVLTEDGYEVVASISADILSEIEQIKPDIILLDEWLCADEKGSDHCRKLKATAATTHIPVIMLSAVANIESLVAEAGADGYIKKPFEIDELHSTILSHLQKGSKGVY